MLLTVFLTPVVVALNRDGKCLPEKPFSTVSALLRYSSQQPNVGLREAWKVPVQSTSGAWKAEECTWNLAVDDVMLVMARPIYVTTCCSLVMKSRAQDEDENGNKRNKSRAEEYWAQVTSEARPLSLLLGASLPCSCTTCSGRQGQPKFHLHRSGRRLAHLPHFACRGGAEWGSVQHSAVLICQVTTKWGRSNVLSLTN